MGCIVTVQSLQLVEERRRVLCENIPRLDEIPLFVEDSVSSCPLKAVPSRLDRAVTFDEAYPCFIFSLISLFLSVIETDAICVLAAAF